MAITTFRATSRKLSTGLAVENKVRNFTVILDESESAGGTDAGMTPVEALLVALGSCQCIVAAAFAKAKKIELQEVWVELEGDLDPSGYIKGAEGVRKGFQEIRLKLHLKSNAPQKQLEEFFAFIAERCPVEDNLLNETPIIRELIPERP